MVSSVFRFCRRLLHFRREKIKKTHNNFIIFQKALFSLMFTIKFVGKKDTFVGQLGHFTYNMPLIPAFNQFLLYEIF